MITVAIGAIFKNESHILQEWIEHYIREGVDKFYLIDNGSTDDYESVISQIRKQISTGVLSSFLSSSSSGSSSGSSSDSLSNLSDASNLPSTSLDLKSRNIEIKLFKDSKKYAQNELYNRYLKNIDADWIIIADLDEFIYSRLGYSTIKEYLQSLPKHISQVHVLWKLFGSNYYIFQPPRVVPFFLYHSGISSNLYKSILRVSSIRSIGIHYSSVSGRSAFCIHNEETGDNFIDSTIVSLRGCKKDLKLHYLHLNHYQVQSWEFFSKVKMTRGDGYSRVNDNMRNVLYYEMQDNNTIFDDELKRKHYPNLP
jgi:hypothetical protein